MSGQRVPWVAYALVAINVVIFVYELLLGPAVDQFLMAWGVVPAYIADPASHPLAFVTLFTSMFLIEEAGSRWAPGSRDLRASSGGGSFPDHAEGGDGSVKQKEGRLRESAQIKTSAG